ESAQAELDAAVRGKGDADTAADTLRERVGTLEPEIEKLRKQVRDLQAESANREVQIAQMEKRHDRDREDLQGLNIALDSKQQELELLKRRMSVKGTAGPTPAPSKVGHIRRESTTFSPPARPASCLSDDNKDASKAGKTSESTARVTTLGKSVRINASATTTPTSTTTSANNKIPTPTTIKPTRTIDGSMGPPPATARQRASLSTTTSPTTSHTRVPSMSSAFGRSATKSPPAVTTARAAHRRPTSMSGTELLRQAKLASSASASASASSDVDRSSASDEKENTMRLAAVPRAPTGSLSSAASKRRSMIASPMS
ncbi:hypothetical protein EI94DRAFT_1587035, partial [Lactarius quietus]